MSKKKANEPSQHPQENSGKTYERLIGGLFTQERDDSKYSQDFNWEGD